MSTSQEPSVKPNHCYKCGAEPEIEKLGPRLWRVVCSANTRPLGSHWVVGHEMFTRKDAVRVWNELGHEAGSGRG
jgi:hypothetical protein